MIKTLIIEIAMRIIAIGFLNDSAVLLTGRCGERRGKRRVKSVKAVKGPVMGFCIVNYLATSPLGYPSVTASGAQCSRVHSATAMVTSSPHTSLA
jgi:hypothetical protein